MPVNYAVHAQVVDIRQDKPTSTDAFLIDTNVWFWIAYPKGGGLPHQTRHYPSFVSQAIRAKAKLHRCELSLSELAHLIEKTDRVIYERANGVTISTKEYRHNELAERRNVAAEVQAAWGQIKTMAGSLPVMVDEPAANAALSVFGSQLLDGYDLFILQAASKAGIVQVLTDDGDYCTVPGIQVFTANSNVIAAAQAQGKLLVR